MTDIEPLINDKPDLNSNDILIAEYEYIAQAAFQTTEDRARVSAFYLVSVGSLIAALFSTQLEGLAYPQIFWAFSLFFTLLSAAGTITLLQLVRLRQAWFDSAEALNHIKRFYIKEGDRGLESAFLWGTETLPSKFKTWSISFLLALQVSILGSVTLGVAVFYLGMAFQNQWWFWALIIAIGYLVLQLILYRILLKE